MNRALAPAAPKPLAVQWLGLVSYVAAWDAHKRLAAERGVWARGGKIASVGLSVKRWVVTHGMALNVALDMSYFALINPCGHPKTAMTSMEQLLGYAPAVAEVGAVFARCFARIFRREIR